MKNFIFLLMFVSATYIVKAQISDSELEGKLIELAWKNNPLTRISEAEVDIARQEAKVIGAEWSTLLGATGNLNEFNIKQFTNPDSNATGNSFFPRYNVYVRVPFSLFIETPRKKKVALAKISLADEKVKLTRIELKGKIQKLYSDYLRNRDTWIIRHSR
jgi:outer membrane protein TolC